MKRNKLTASLLAAVLSASACTALPASALDLKPTEPDWVPKTAEEAVTFLNEHGNTYVKDHFICIVEQFFPEKSEPNGIKCSGTMPYYSIVSKKKLEYQPVTEPPEQPENGSSKDEQRIYAERLADYEKYCALKERYGEAFFETVPYYQVIVMMAESTGDLEVGVHTTFTRTVGAENYDKDGNPLTAEKSEQYDSAKYFTFTRDNQDTYETDYYGWLPDSPAEFDAFREKYGSVSLYRNGFGAWVVVCESVNGSTGAELFVTQNGESCSLNYAGSADAYSLLPVMAGGTSARYVYCYIPYAVGRTDIAVFNGRVFDDSPAGMTHAAFSVREEDGELYMDAVPAAAYDLNADGELSIADLVLLTKHLMGEDTLSDAQLLIADNNLDKHVDAKDLSGAKRLLLEGAPQESAEQPEPANEA